MAHTYRANLRGNTIEWVGPQPVTNGADNSIAVEVTILPTHDTEAKGRGRRMAAILEEISRLPERLDIGDAATWEREIRVDRPLPGRGE